MTGVPHRSGAQRAMVPEIVLPVTSRGLALSERVCAAILAVAMVAAAGLILYLSRGTIFFADELDRFLSSPDRGLVDVFEPHGGHLTATSNLLFKGLLEAFGSEYLAFRLVGVTVLLAAAGLFYLLAKRRVGPVVALAPALVLLFFGSSWDMVVIPFGFNMVAGSAAGLAALLALERDDRLGDVLACALLTVAVLTFSVGLAFAVGVAVAVLARPDRWQRAWVFAIPVAVYLAWWAWALPREDSVEQGAQLSNALLIPSYIADSAAAVIAAVVGMGYEFTAPLERIDPGWGRVLAVPAAVGLAVAIWRGPRPVTLWVAIAIALAMWSLGALVVGEIRVPGARRYLYAGAVVVLLVAVEAARSARFSRLGVVALFAVCAISLATNVALLRDGAGFARSYSETIRASFTAVELARDRVDPGFRPLEGAPLGGFLDTPASTYLTALDRYGSIAFTEQELERESEPARQRTDTVLAGALGLRLVTPAPAGAERGDCRRVRGGEPGGELAVPLPSGGARLEAEAAGPVPLTVGRYARPSAEVGELSPGEAALLEIPRDRSTLPWVAAAPGARSLEACPL